MGMVDMFLCCEEKKEELSMLCARYCVGRSGSQVVSVIHTVTRGL